MTTWNKMLSVALALSLVLICFIRSRYSIENIEVLELVEYSSDEYETDPANKSSVYSQYNDRELKLIRKTNGLFDFRISYINQDTSIVVSDVDIGLMTPNVPVIVKEDSALTKISLIERQWNRQQVSFSRDSVSVVGEDSFDHEHLYTVELAKNCLNAGLWEVLLTTREQGEKRVYYHGWFDLPLGHYRALFSKNTGLEYFPYAWFLEHWSDPEGLALDLSKLRKINWTKTIELVQKFGPILSLGSQSRKKNNIVGSLPQDWFDGFKNLSFNFSRFVKPGVYKLDKPMGHKLERFHKITSIELSQISIAEENFLELRLNFAYENGNYFSFVVGGLDFGNIPVLNTNEYAHSLMMPMGIATPPFNQSYRELLKENPKDSRYYSMLLDEKSKWLNHHEWGIDGPVLYRDVKDPTLIHLHFLSYERHILLGHYIIDASSYVHDSKYQLSSKRNR